MLTVTFGLALTLVLVAKAVTISGRHSLDMGTMSRQWVMIHHASQPAPSV
jgi:hypothetical protein